MSRYRIVDVKQKLNNEQEKHVYKLQKKNIFGTWKDMKHDVFDVFNGRVKYLRGYSTYFKSITQAIDYLKELIAYEKLKKKHWFASPAYVFAAYNAPLSEYGKEVNDIGFVPLDILGGNLFVEWFKTGRETVSFRDVAHSKKELFVKMNYLLGNKVKEEEFLYLYDENVHEDGSAGWTIV